MEGYIGRVKERRRGEKKKKSIILLHVRVYIGAVIGSTSPVITQRQMAISLPIWP